jgi:hypothetical protein
MASEDNLEEMQMEPGALYREEVFTDRRVGAIRLLTPVKADGSTDAARAVVYLGQAQLYTAAGALPLSFEIEAGSLEEAVGNFAYAAQAAIEQTMQELEELRREAASSIVIPQGGMSGLGGAGPIGSGGPGGGKIRLR